uniref:PRA1 family protein n=1 Tax=Rhizophora mucronata TaxID=61149 RepID=A0A2P2J1U3_RHIMU
MVFSTNPLSLTVPDPAFESWLRDSGYLEILDQRSSSSAVAAAAAASTATISSTTIPTTAVMTGGLFVSLFSPILTVLSLFTLNPFSKLTADDFAVQTPSWTSAFVGDSRSYSFPSGSDQARLRVHENVKRYARNYASLFILFFACALYQMPVALIGLISSLALWDIFKFCNDRWGWDRYPVIRQVLVRTAQFATAVILILLNVQMALFSALTVSYAVMVLHAAFRKLTPTKLPSRRR